MKFAAFSASMRVATARLAAGAQISSDSSTISLIARERSFDGRSERVSCIALSTTGSPVAQAFFGSTTHCTPSIVCTKRLMVHLSRLHPLHGGAHLKCHLPLSWEGVTIRPHIFVPDVTMQCGREENDRVTQDRKPGCYCWCFLCCCLMFVCFCMIFCLFVCCCCSCSCCCWCWWWWWCCCWWWWCYYIIIIIIIIITIIIIII